MTKPNIKKMFKTDKELQDKIDKYFKTQCGVKVVKEKGKILRNKKGEPIYKINPPTISGLALFLGFGSRQSFYDYEKNSLHSYTIKKARLTCEKFAEEQLFTSTPTGAIFWLKNSGWKDVQENLVQIKPIYGGFSRHKQHKKDIQSEEKD